MQEGKNFANITRQTKKREEWAGEIKKNVRDDSCWRPVAQPDQKQSCKLQQFMFVLLDAMERRASAVEREELSRDDTIVSSILFIPLRPKKVIATTL